MFSSSGGNPFNITQIEKYQIIDRLKERYPIRYMCEKLEIGRSSYYKWITAGRAIWNNYDEDHARIMYNEHFLQKERYGVDRLKHEIQNRLGIIFNHKKVRRYLRNMGLLSTNRKRRSLYVQEQKKGSHMNTASNLINNNFTSSRPLEKMSTDVSYIKCTEGFIYLSAVKDLFNNEIIAYSVSDKNDINLIKNTMEKIPSGVGIIHSDQGAVYASPEYIELLETKGLKRSMSRKGACWENSPIENWFSQLKQESLYPAGIQSAHNTIKTIKKYVQWYNTERIQASLKYQSPIQFRYA